MTLIRLGIDSMLYRYLQGIETEVEAMTTHVVAITGNPELGVEPEGTLTGITSQKCD